MYHHLLSIQDAQEQLRSHWGIEGELTALPSYADTNFLVREIPHGEKWIFKIANSSWHYDDLALENAVLRHLATQADSDCFPKVRLTQSGEDLMALPSKSSPQTGCWMRVLSFVEGSVYAQAAKTQDLAQLNQLEQLEQSLGITLAKLTRGLRHFTHAQAHRHVAWNMMHLPDLLTSLPLIEDTSLRHVVEKHVRYFQSQQADWDTHLPITIIHNDANDLNVIVRDNQVAAIIDFGDMCTSYRIAELAIAACYAMQFSDKPLASVARIAQSYHRLMPLLLEEQTALFPFVMARLCQSILMAERAKREQPDNTFIVVSQQAVRRLLMQLDVYSNAQAMEMMSLPLDSI